MDRKNERIFAHSEGVTIMTHNNTKRPIHNRKPISVEEAIEAVHSRTKRGETEYVSIEDAHGRYLGENLVADHPIPAFDRAAMDGFAIVAADTEQASFEQPVHLTVIDSVAAGEVTSTSIASGQAIRIMTGAQIPQGTTAVIMLEHVQESTNTNTENKSETTIRIHTPVNEGQHISYKGEDVQYGTTIAEAGRRISAGEMAMLATFGYSRVKVYRQPLIGIFVTGTELLSVAEPMQPGKIRNSNSYMLISQIKQLGAIPKYYGILEDDFDKCYIAIQKALTEVDLLITTGGAAVGDYDFVPALLQKLKAEVLFNKVAMRPGSVTTVAQKENKWIFGLSGNPSACYVGFELFVRPILKALLGANIKQLPKSKAIIEHDIEQKKKVTRFMRSFLKINGDKLTVSSIGVDKSGIASSLVKANALIIVPPNRGMIRKGEEVDVIWLDRPDEGMFELTGGFE